MAIEGFDYKGFAASMAEQAKDLVPKELQPHEKEYVVKTLGNFTMLAGEALYNDTSLNINADQAVLITQIIAEWAYHKSIDLIHSGILPEYWDGIMQKIAFTIFEVAKQAIIKNIPQDQMLQAVEHHVIKVYTQSVEELKSKGIIDDNIMQQAIHQSNIDAMAQQAKETQAAQQQAAQHDNQTPQSNEAEVKQLMQNSGLDEASITAKQMKLMSLSITMKILSQDKIDAIFRKLNPEDTETIKKYMGMANLESHVDSDLFVDNLQEIKKIIPVTKVLTKEKIMSDLYKIFDTTDRETIEKVLRKERPLIKRFIAQAYDQEFEAIPLRIADILIEYIKESARA